MYEAQFFSVFKRDLICNFFAVLKCMKSKKAQKLAGIIRDVELLKEE